MNVTNATSAPGDKRDSTAASETRQVLISPSSFGAAGPAPLEQLRQAGFEILMNQTGRRLTSSEVVEQARDCVGIVAGVEPLTGDVLRQLPKLRCISRVGSGLESVDLEAARRLGITVRSTPQAPVQAVAELTVGLILCLLRGISAADRDLHAGTWSKRTGSLISGRTVGIVGVGRIGRRVAELLASFGCALVAADPAPDREWAAANDVELLPLDQLLAASDIVTVHAAPPAGSPPLLGAREIGTMRTGAWLVNVARGGAIDEKAVHDALVDGRLAGAAIDVFADEPYAGPLTALESTVLTPHLGSYAVECRRDMEWEAVNNLLEALSGLPK